MGNIFKTSQNERYRGDSPVSAPQEEDNHLNEQEDPSSVQSKRWADMISRINADVDTLKSVGAIKYSKKEKIGTGSSGSHIFGGKYGSRDVAVKKIVNENVQMEAELHELMKTKPMSNILKILHIERDDDFTYVVTNLCEYDLKAVIEDDKNPVGDCLTPEKRVKLCEDILRGLKDLHSINVIHRDLKPNNILIDVNGDAFVADFGISRNIIGATTLLTSGYGTLCWIAYESNQLDDDKVTYKKKSDVQVAGCLVYYILSNGHHPFEATSPFIIDTVQLMSNVQEGKFSLLHVKSYPEKCTTLLTRMLDRDMTKRPHIADCLKEMEAVRKSYISSTKENALTNDDDQNVSSTASEQGARPKTRPIGHDSGYGQFRLTLESNLTYDNAVTIAHWFGYGNAEIDNISRSDNPSRTFVQCMDQKGEIGPTDISKLIEAMEDKTVGLRGTAVKVKEAFESRTPSNHSTSVTNEKKTQFVTELKNKYEELCGKFRPAPFVRDKYDISELFVESGMKFLTGILREKNRKEKCIELKDYKEIFTDPKINSKRRIVDGEPGLGKSTLALQITHDWCQKSPPINNFEILILLLLSQFRNVSDIYIAIKKFLLPTDSKLTVEDIKRIMDSSTTVILFDEYDKYPHRGNRNNHVECIMRGDMCQKHDVVLMTRTSCLPQDYSCDTKRIRLTEFDDYFRQMYIEKVLKKDGAEKVNSLLKENAVLADLCTLPMFFFMIPHMAKKMDTLRDLKTVTKFFARIIACFEERRVEITTYRRRDKRDHSELDKAAFEALKADSQKITWDEEDLRGKIGDDLYEEYVGIGILIEEEIFDDETSGYKTETRFLHKMFAEWYAAHYLAQEAAKPETEFEPWLSLPTQDQRTLQHRWADRNNVHILSNLNPRNLDYTYRYACGLNRDAALRIIAHLGKVDSFQECLLLCIQECGGSLEPFKAILDLICSDSLSFRASSVLQERLVELMGFACSRKVPIELVYLENCLNLDASTPGNLCLKPSNLFLPAITTTLRRIVIQENGVGILEEELECIFQYAAKCLGLESLEFYICMLSRVSKVTESVRVLRSRKVKVLWCTGDFFLLNLETGKWEDMESGKPMTQEQFNKAIIVVLSWSQDT